MEALPSTTVTSEPLPPPPGASVSGPGPTPIGPVAGLNPSAPVVTDLPSTPIPVVPAEPTGPATPARPSRSAAVGTYTARDASGASCRVSLSSSPALDLYRASANGCGNKDLARVTAWDFRDGDVYLYQPGGAVAARLRSADDGLAGVLSKSGAPLTLTR